MGGSGGLFQWWFVWILVYANGGSFGLFQWWFVWILVYANGGSVNCSDGGSYGSWFMPTAEVWFGWIVPMVVCMDLGLCQRRFGWIVPMVVLLQYFVTFPSTE
jgi:hypothetical protein